MRYTGITSEILLSILFITAVAMFLIGVIAFKVTERVALEGKIESVKSLTSAVESEYFIKNNVMGGIDFIKNALPDGSWALVKTRDGNVISATSEADKIAGKSDPLIKEALSSNKIAIDIEGVNLPPLTDYKGFKSAIPVNLPGGERGAVLIYEPLGALDQNISLGQRMIAVWTILFLLVIAFFGFYILSRRVIKPVRQLTQITEEIAYGKFPAHRKLGKVKELNQLYDSLRVMYEDIEEGKKSLRDNIKELEHKNEELKRTQSELIASEKLASLGRLSAGVAHEIGNPLSAINGYVDVLKKSPSLSQEAKAEYIADIEREIKRLDGIIKSLLEYARPKKYTESVVDLNTVVTDSLRLLERQGVLKNISLKKKLSDTPLLIESDSGQLSQVIINLVLNAKDAAEESAEIEISTGEYSEDELYISVRDNGKGIPSEIIDSIFDPFFTTKDPGAGTGLGLSVSQRIVQTFGGTIDVMSKEGEGTVFTLKFPRLKSYDKAENFNS